MGWPPGVPAEDGPPTMTEEVLLCDEDEDVPTTTLEAVITEAAEVGDCKAFLTLSIS